MDTTIELQTASNLGMMKEQGRFYHVDDLRVLVMVTLWIQGLWRATQCVFHK